MRKFVFSACVMALVVSLVGCGEQKTSTTTVTTPTTSTTAVTTTTSK